VTYTIYESEHEWPNSLEYQTWHDRVDRFETGPAYRQANKRNRQGYSYQITDPPTWHQSPFGERRGRTRKRNRKLRWDRIRSTSRFDLFLNWLPCISSAAGVGFNMKAHGVMCLPSGTLSLQPPFGEYSASRMMAERPSCACPASSVYRSKRFTSALPPGDFLIQARRPQDGYLGESRFSTTSFHMTASFGY
jgi:hypothetical protein